MIGDSSNGLSTINTLNTLAGFNAVAKQTKKPISMIYLDNAADKADNTNSKLESVDKSIFNTLSVLSAFLSGDASALDQKDMAALIDQSIYKTIDIKPGLYNLAVFSGEVKLPDHLTPTIGRTLTTESKSADLNIGLFHHKFGVTSNRNVIDVFGNNFPIHLVTTANYFSIIEMDLKAKSDKIKQALDLTTVDDVSGASDEVADDNCLVF